MEDNSVTFLQAPAQIRSMQLPSSHSSPLAGHFALRYVAENHTLGHMQNKCEPSSLPGLACCKQVPLTRAASPIEPDYCAQKSPPVNECSYSFDEIRAVDSRLTCSVL